MEADLVVVGHRGQGPWESALLGAVAREVVDHAPCPVLVAREERLGPVVLVDDGSPRSVGAEDVVSGWSLLSGLAVTVVSVTEDGGPYATGDTTALQAARGVTRATSAAATARLRAAGVDATGQVREGDPAQQVIKVARERGAGLIVIGTRGRTGLRRLVLGGVARNVLLHAPCSVLVVREVAALDGRGIQRYREERAIVSSLG
jgi:nucleotide-binding universal stress UspA family protein